MINYDEADLVQKSGNYFILKTAKHSGIKKNRDKSHLALLSSSRNNLSRQKLGDLVRKLGIV